MRGFTTAVSSIAAEEQGDEERALLRKYAGQFEVRSNAAHTPAHAYYSLNTVTEMQRIE